MYTRGYNTSHENEENDDNSESVWAIPGEGFDTQHGGRAAQNWDLGATNRDLGAQNWGLGVQNRELGAQNRGQVAPNRAAVFHTATVALLTAFVVIAVLWLAGYLKPPNSVTFGTGGHDASSVVKLQQVWNLLSRGFYEEPDEDKMIEYAAAGMALAVNDPYTIYYPKDEMAKYKDRVAGNYHGIGVYTTREEDGRLVITGFLLDSPAEEAGVLSGDEIISVDGVDVRGESDLDKVVEMVKGADGTMVVIGVFRAQENRTLEFEIIRKVIKVENIKSRIIAGDIGYVQILMFDSSADEYFKKHVDDLIEEGIRGLVIDIRNNLGGGFDSAVAISNMVLGEGVIVYIEDRYGNREYKYSDAGKLDIPIRVLTNGNSASASEILAGAVKDHEAGLVIGTKTYGKGVVQDVVTLNDGSGLVYTKSRYFTPSGVCIDGEGIEPDEAVELPQEYDGVDVSTIPYESDLQLQRAIGSF